MTLLAQLTLSPHHAHHPHDESVQVPNVIELLPTKCYLLDKWPTLKDCVDIILPCITKCVDCLFQTVPGALNMLTFHLLLNIQPTFKVFEKVPVKPMHHQCSHASDANCLLRVSKSAMFGIVGAQNWVFLVLLFVRLRPLSRGHWGEFWMCAPTPFREETFVPFHFLKIMFRLILLPVFSCGRDVKWIKSKTNAIVSFISYLWHLMSILHNMSLRLVCFVWYDVSRCGRCSDSGSGTPSCEQRRHICRIYNPEASPKPPP